MGELEGYKVGQIIRLADGREATIKWLGVGDFAPGEWLGLELAEASGKNNGEVKGKRYFQCPDNHGMMVRPGAVDVILEQPPAPPPPKAATSTAAKRTSVVGGVSNGTKTASLATRTRPAAAGPASRRQTLVDPINKRQSLNAASPTPASRGAPGRGIPSPTKSSAKPAGGRPPSISGPLKVASTNAPTSSVTSTAAKRTSIVGRPSVSSTAASARTARSSIVGAAAGPSKSASASAPVPGVARRTAANRLSTLQQPASRRTASISSRTEASEQESTGPDDEDEDQGATGNGESIPRQTSGSGRAVLSPPVSAREPTTPNLSRPTTQQLSAQNRKIDDLETKLRVLEKQKAEDKERLKELERASSERDKFEGLIQKLQAKIQPLSQECTQLKKDLKETEERAANAESAQADVDEQIEMAALDREMAEELAEGYKSELDAIRKTHEELKLEVEILRAENEDLGREMSPEERDSMGFAQLEKSNERLREALVRLRDITQDTEAELRDQIKELQDESSELDTVKARYDETQEQLEQAEALSAELKQQLETAQGAEEMIEELTEKNMSLNEQIEGLKSAVEDLESLKDINDELEMNHVEHEKAMQEDIDYRDALLLEQARKMTEQDEIVEELEYTVSRFRELVANLNSDLEDMRASKNITEAEANELGNQTKAMMDLNMRLQQSAAKTQVKVIDTETKRLEAQEAMDHLAIVQLFLPESYAQHRDSVTAFLRFKRVSFKATMLHSFIREKVSGLAVPGHEEDMFAACEVLDRLIWIGAMCDRFVKYIVSCPLEVFSQIGNASYDLDPVERTFNGFVESLKRDELKDQQCAADLQRTMSVLEHLGERYLGDGLADWAEAVRMRALVMQSNLDTAASAIAHIKSISQARVVLPTDADETDEEVAQAFLSRADNVVSQIRSAKVIAGKALHQLDELQSRSLTLEPSTQASLESTESAVAALAASCRSSGVAVAKLVNEDARLDSLTFEQVMHAVSSGDAAPFSALTSNANAVITAVQSFSSLTTTLSQTVEFTASQAKDLSATTTPWSQLAARVREESSASVGHEAEIARLHDQLNERSTALALKDKTVSELNVSVEVLEKRAADATKATSRARDLEQQLQQGERKVKDLEARLVRSVDETRSLRLEREAWLAAGEAKAGAADQAGGEGGQQVAGAGGNAAIHPDFVSAKAIGEIAALKAELEVTQSVVRQLRIAAREANLSSARAEGILDSLTPEPKLSTEEYEAGIRERSARAAFKTLRGLVSRDDASVVQIHDVAREDRLKWRPAKETVEWQVGQRREEWESWKELVATVAKDEKHAERRSETLRQARREKAQAAKSAASALEAPRGEILAKLTLKGLPMLESKPANGDITIVDPGEWDGLGRRLGLVY